MKPKKGTFRLTRRDFFRAASVGPAAAWLAACDGAGDGESSSAEAASAATGRETAQAPRWVKDPSPFVQRVTNLETRLELIDGFITPNELFFVRNHSPTPRIDPGSYSLRVEGDGAETALSLDLSTLESLPQRTITAYLECAGNWRGLYPELTGTRASGGQWSTGAVGCAEWSGPSLATVLELAGVRPEAVDVNLVGLDSSGFERAMPLAKALDPDTLIALRMNGEPLPPDHGFPARSVVPGWSGSNSIKWLGRIQVSTERVWNRNNTSSYVLIGDQWPEQDYAPAQGMVINELVVKSALALPRPAQLPPGPHAIHGFAHAPAGPVAAVEWSPDGGATWLEATIVEPILPLAWQRFEFEWEATAGSHTLVTRATDAAGNTQPEEPLMNEKGYLLNVPLPHPIEVE
ncbi:sulfite oxidase [Candidatus Palauibacter sp.]|uniref:sulfite oxidase n=1 Tax=Candidatus Palauibacter sp. TaxID=3101350 RepID=UPI003B5A141D